MILETFSPWYSDTRPAWEAAVAAWLAEAGRACSLGEIQSTTTVKERPWSLVRRVVFANGSSYFKACSAAGKHEPALHLFLEEHFEIAIPRSQAVDLDQAWILTDDAGEPLRHSLQGAESRQAFVAMLARYGAMQISSLCRVEHLLDIGLPDRRLRHLPQLLETLLAELAPGASQSAQDWLALRAAALDRQPQLEQVCRQLDRSPYAAALDHGDLHPANLLLRGDELRLCDWGDACITHPFCSMLTSLEMAPNEIAPSDRASWARSLRDAYLEPWTALAPRAQLLIDFHRALWLAHLLRALNFAHMIRGAPEKVLNRWRPLLFERLEMWVNHHIE